MNWFTRVLTTSIGKKLIMALTGLGFINFLYIHLIGNLTLYGGKDYFNSYVKLLHSLGPLIKIIESIFFIMAIAHIFTGLLLFVQNMSARPSRYAVNKSAGGRTLASATMPYTGLFIIIFVLFHITNFHSTNRTDTTVFDIVYNAFQDPYYVLFYIVAIIAAAFHVSHGFWSAFQTFGLNNAKYMPFIKSLSLAISLIVGFGFGLIPLYLLIM